MDATFLASWRDDVLDTLADERDLDAVAALLTGLRLPDDLLDLYRMTREVSLPDICGGYSVPGPWYPIALRERREPLVVDGTPPVEVLVFAADGGGTMYALPADSGPVLRLPPPLSEQAAGDGGAVRRRRTRLRSVARAERRACVGPGD